ncbi:MAG: pyridoxal 5'-phosphate synthase glutaminase subunit PdxT [Alkalispirochaetaceae bacterium]
MTKEKKVGVLSFQGDFARHAERLEELGARVVSVRTPEGIEQIDGLVIPGGESTTIGMLMERFGLLEAVRKGVSRGLAVFGTCAGAILLAREIRGSRQPRLALMETEVERNAYGRQIDSFEASFSSDFFVGEPLKGVFIRAPIIAAVHPPAEVIAVYEDQPVVVRQGKLLAATFHPELTDDLRLHQYFLETL